MSPIRPDSLDHETIERLRELVATTYAGRDDLYEAARNLKDEDLVAICRKLAEDLAANSTHLAQILAMHGKESGGASNVRAVLTEEIIRYLHGLENDKGVLSAAKAVERGVREQYEATIAATNDPETQALLKKQREEAAFGEQVLRRIAEGKKTADETNSEPRSD